MRKTKIICTIGPACENEETLSAMCLAGMNVARLNFSHGTHAEHQKKIDLIKSVREKLGLPIAIMLDTKGPEYRIRTFEKGKVTLREGDRFTFTTEQIVGNEERVAVSYPGMMEDLAVGDRILLNNGLLSFEVEELTATDAVCRVLVGGETSNNKSMSFPNKVLSQAYLSEQDKKDILFGIQNDVDFIACSFVSRRQDLEDIHDFLRQHEADHIGLIAKIENQPGIDNIEEICQVCEGIMIGRGDLGVEVPFEQLPSIQKRLITKCRLLGKRVITATEMLESMIQNARPTRAEISDVANAVYDGSQDFRISNTVDAISHATCGVAIDIGAKAIVACSLSGMTVRMVSRFRPPVDILGLTTNERTWRRLALSWGVLPAMCDEFPSTDVLFYSAQQKAKEMLHLEKGDKIVITGGVTNGRSGNTNLIKVENI